MATPIKLKTQEERELWKSICAAVASSSNPTDTDTYSSIMYEWADNAIQYFRERTTHEAGRPNSTES